MIADPVKLKEGHQVHVAVPVALVSVRRGAAQGVWRLTPASVRRNGAGEKKTEKSADAGAKEGGAKETPAKSDAGGTPRDQWEADARNYVDDLRNFQAIEWADRTIAPRPT